MGSKFTRQCYHALDFGGFLNASGFLLVVGETADGHADFACLPPWCDKPAGAKLRKTLDSS